MVQGCHKSVASIIDTLQSLKAAAGLVIYEELFEEFQSNLSDLQQLVKEDGDFCPIYSAKLQGETVLVVRQNRFCYQGYDHAQVTSSVRVSHY